jgi:hypothetical protein
MQTSIGAGHDVLALFDELAGHGVLALFDETACRWSADECGSLWHQHAILPADVQFVTQLNEQTVCQQSQAAL